MKYAGYTQWGYMAKRVCFPRENCSFFAIPPGVFWGLNGPKTAKNGGFTDVTDYSDSPILSGGSKNTLWAESEGKASATSVTGK
jgi:hypothetical protein